MPFCPNSSSCQKQLAKGYQPYVYGNCFDLPRFWKKVLFSNKLSGGKNADKLESRDNWKRGCW